MSAWRPALRIAWRDALRHRGRSILVLVMVALPVLAVSAAAVVYTSAEVTGVEGADRQMGSAAARVWTEGPGRILQAADPDRQGYLPVDLPGTASSTEPLDEAAIRDVLGEDVRLLPIRDGWSGTRIGDRLVAIEVTEVDLTDPLAGALFDLTSGQLPETADEVVVNDAMLAKGLEVGDDLQLTDGSARIVGVGRDAEQRSHPAVLGVVGSVLTDDAAGDRRDWLVGTDAVSWGDVQALNAVGGIVASRAVLADPPDVADLAQQLGYDTGEDELVAVAVLIVVMALLEVVLLAGPAFAVGARRQSRSLALMAASGGTPAQSRRVVLASGLVLGAVASALGLVLGVLAGIALLPVVQRFQGTWFGPLDIPVLWLAAITVFGLVSAFLASVVPAWIASRQDVVAVLAGRRGERKPRTSTPVLGLLLLGVGMAGSTIGSLDSDSGNGAILMAASAVVSVLGMIMVVPVVVSVVGRAARRLPLTMRYAARDAARHRTRTVPAVAAVAATVAGVVALGIANASDERENEQTYLPQAPMGSGYITWGPELLAGEEAPDPEPVWAQLEQIVQDNAPDVEVQRTRGADGSYAGGFVATYVTVPPELEQEGWGISTYGPSVAVAESAAELGVDGDTAALIDSALADGLAVVFVGSATAEATEVTIRRETYSETSEDIVAKSADVVDAQLVPWGAASAPAVAVVPESMARDLDLPVVTSSLRLVGDLDRGVQTRIDEEVKGAVAGTYFYVERGYERPDEAVIILLVLFTLGGVLMLGGTLTATFLALSDARPDLATLAAVGAAPRTRRGVAASYALVVGFVGAILGAGVGFIPGVAISRPLTSSSGSGPYLDIPWLMIGALVLVLPLLTAAIVGLSARSRLPLVARLD